MLGDVGFGRVADDVGLLVFGVVRRCCSPGCEVVSRDFESCNSAEGGVSL